MFDDAVARTTVGSTVRGAAQRADQAILQTARNVTGRTTTRGFAARLDPYTVTQPRVAPRPTIPRNVTNATVGATDEVFHYTSREFVESIRANGLRPGSYATPDGRLSPLQAHIELALPPNTGLRDAVIRIDVAGLRQAGYAIPDVTRVSSVVRGASGRVYSMPGGGYELQFPYAIPPEFIKVMP